MRFEVRRAPETSVAPLTVWQAPDPHAVYVVGADVAEGLDYGDYSSAHVIDVRDGSVVATWHGHAPADVFGEELFMLGGWYNQALLCVEVNNHGLTTVTRLKQLGYRNLWRRREEHKVTFAVSVEYGWRTSVQSKPVLIDALARAIRNEELLVPCEFTLAELRTFVRDQRARMHGSPHDDRVISLALANYMRQYAYLPEYKPQRDLSGTFAELLGQREDGSLVEDWVVGNFVLRGV